MVVVIVMGVCGSGKTSVGQAIAEEIGCVFADADDYHPEVNVDKMSRGIPLTDEDRLPWLQSLHSAIKKWEEESHKDLRRSTPADNPEPDLTTSGGCQLMKLHHVVTGVLACSALRRIYRTTLLKDQNSAVSSDSKLRCVLVLLQGNEETIQARLQGRRGHYMPTSLLHSQLDTLEVPTEDEAEGLIVIEDLTKPVNNIVSKIIQQLVIIVRQKTTTKHSHLS